MFSRTRQHKRTGSSPSAAANEDRGVFQSNLSAQNLHDAPPTIAPVYSPAASPLGVDFDFDLPLSSLSGDPSSGQLSQDRTTAPSVGNFSRPRTSDGGNTPRKSTIGLNPPVLPPIPRVASRYEKDRGQDGASVPQSNTARQFGFETNTSMTDRTNVKSENGPLKPRLSFEHPVDLLSLSPRDTAGMQSETSTAKLLQEDNDIGSGPKMESSLFPPKPGPAMKSATENLPIMSRSFIDSRDKPYSQPVSKPFVRTTNLSTPDLLVSHSAVEAGSSSARPPATRLRSQQSTQSLASRTTSTGLSGTTARPSTQASLLSGSGHTTPTITIGTPYSETSSSFPVPERVSTRPRGAHNTSNVAGVAVPTHYSSSAAANKSDPKSGDGKKRGRLLNPMSVFQRRKSGQDADPGVETRTERQAQAQALARQKDVVAGGVSTLPADFDPSIKGKLVHDFSAPRTKRNTFGEFEPTVVAQLQSSMGTPSPPADAHSSRSSSLPHNQAARDSNSRLSARTPVFKEHLNEEADASGRVNSIHAENLENKDFLKRASMHSNSNYSQDSTMLPPFARRSQVLDPAQAALYQENDSKRSSDRSADKGQDSSVSSVHLVSPVMAHHDSQGGASDFRRSISPVSPSTPNLPPGPPSPGYAIVAQQGSSPTYASTTLTPRPVSGVLALPTRESVAGPSAPASPMPVSPIEPYAPVNIPSTRQDDAQNSPLHFTPLARDEHEQQHSVFAPSVPSSAVPTSSPGKKLVLDESAGFPTPERTPEPEKRASQASRPPSQPKKRASAGARSKRAFSGPRHHASTASRFSFQYASGESAAEEHALEDKHRKLAKRRQTALNTARGPSPDEEEDEDDYFDEDAMDDLDEMEMQDQEPYDELPEHTMPTMPTQGLASMQQAREMLQTADSDDSDYGDEGDTSNVTDERLLPYADHPAYRTHSAIMTPHTSMNPGSADAYWRGSTVDNYLRDSTTPQRPRNTSGASALTVNTNVGPFGSAAVSNPNPNPNPYMQPASLDKTGLGQRDDRSRVVSGMSFSSASDATRSPPRGGSGSWAIRGGSRGQDMHAYGGSAGVLPGQAISPPLSQRESSSIGGASRSASGFSSARSLRSPKPDQTMQSEHSSPNAQPPVTSSDFSSPGEREGFGNYPSPVSVKGHSSASPQRAVAAGLGLNALSRFDYDDSPTIPFPVAQPNEPKGWQKSGLSVAMVPSASQGVDGQYMQAVPSPPVTAEMKGLGFFGSDARSMQSPHSSWRKSSHLPSTDPGQVSASDKSGKAENDANTFSDFNFNDSASLVKNDGSVLLHGTTQTSPAGPVSTGADQLEVANSGAMYHGDVGRGLQIRSQQPARQVSQRPSAPLTSDAYDDMYYDDGNFHDEDMHGLHGDSIDESAFDNDTFLNSGSAFHRRDDSNMSANSMGSDGPYPFFAMPNAAKARQRDSQLMLEDLPLQDAVDPKLIPRRNPSEDAKRLGMSSKVPPLPVAASNTEAFAHMQADLQQYHATLADAANKAAANGRFSRAPSTSTVRSPSGASSKYLREDRGHFSRDTQSLYSNGEDRAGGGAVFDFDGNGVNRAPSYQTTSSQFTQKSYSPQRMNFDFGFDPAPNDDEYDMNDDDLVAAANAEALASDDEGFYGQEFHFYGRPRSNSGEVNPMHGGYFGEDGDDGLARNRSLKEPNLTPITERSEFSTRNSFIGMGQPFSAGGIPGSAGPFGPHSPALARLPVSPWTDNDITSFDQLRKLRANAFGDSTTSLNSSNRSSAYSQPGGHSPGAAHALPRPNYLGSGSGGAPMMHGSSNDSSGSSNPASSSFTFPGNTNAGSSTILSPTALYDSPVSAPASASAPAAVSSGAHAGDHDSTLLATPKRSSLGQVQTSGSPEPPLTARKLALQTPSSPSHTHSRKSSSNSTGGGGGGGGGAAAADSVTYVREQDPEGSGKPRWVLERRRTSSQGQLELVGRELVQGGWI